MMMFLAISDLQVQVRAADLKGVSYRSGAEKSMPCGHQRLGKSTLGFAIMGPPG